MRRPVLSAASGDVGVNFLPQDEGERTPDAYGPNYARLAEIKQKDDPDNLLRANQNIRPAAGASF